MSDSPNFNLEFFRKEAKALLKRCRAGDAQAIGRMRAQLPRLAPLDDAVIADQIQLADVQHAIAREQHRVNWADLKREDAPLDRFLAAARALVVKDAQRELAKFPDMADESIHVASVLGDPDAVIHHLNLDPSLLTAEHAGWTPLVYACASPFGRVNSRQAAGIAETVRVLLDHGADPNTQISNDPFSPETQVSVAYRAMMSGNMSVMRWLMERGAKVDWQDQLKSFENRHPGLMQGFTDHFQRPDVRRNFEGLQETMRQRREAGFYSMDPWTFLNRKPPVFPDSSLEMYKMVLTRGEMDPNKVGTDGYTFIQRLAQTGTPAMAELFLDHGADPNRPAADGRAAFALAIRAGNKDFEDVLRARGASDVGLRPIDEWIGACVREDAARAKEIVKTRPDLLASASSEDGEVFVQSAARNDLGCVRLMAECGFPLGTLGESGVSALHVAAWHGLVDMVHVLLEFHAPVNLPDATYVSSPLAWAAHGSKNCRNADDTYCAIVTALLNADANRESAISRAGARPESLATERVAALISG
jgi:ankyrin repeat protein